MSEAAENKTVARAQGAGDPLYGIIPPLVRIQRFVSPFQDAVRQFALAIGPVLEQYRAAAETLHRQLRLVAEDMSRATDHLVAHGWTVPAEFSIPHLRHLASAADEGADVDALVVAFFDDAENQFLDRLLESLIQAELFREWRPLLVQTIEAFRGGHFAISIPALFVVFEGVVAELDRQRTARNTSVRKMAARIARKEPEFIFGWKSVVEFTDVVFGDENFGSTRTRLNRHRVLHGRDNPGNWGRLDALRLLNALGTIEALVDDEFVRNLPKGPAAT